MKINARPNLNGNSGEDFKKAAIRLNQAMPDLDLALGVLVRDVFHPRNYQHLEQPEARLRLADDRDLIERIRATIRDCNLIAEELFHIGTGE
jgi:hypothetical protein